MTIPDFTSRPVWDEMSMDVPADEAFETARERLRTLGYKPIEPVGEQEDGSLRVTASLDRSPAVVRRRNGKLMLAAAVAMTTVVLFMMASDIGGDRAIISGPLLVAVLLGGFGMNRLREPLRPENKVMQVTVIPMQEGHCRVLIRGTLVAGLVAPTEEPPTKAEAAAAEQALLEDMRVVEGRRGSGKDAP
ncbi:MAG: hypothetical protein OXE50_03485 [Chloroflexi bacterium]|nr:hypothetical protein [Chloroflexota bacterium]